MKIGKQHKDEREKPAEGARVGARVSPLHAAQEEGVNEQIQARVRNSLENTERVKPTALEILSHPERPQHPAGAATFKLFH